MMLDWACAWIWRHGGDVFSKDGKKCLLNEPAAVAAIQDIADLHLRYQVINYGSHQEDFREGFNSGRTGTDVTAASPHPRSETRTVWPTASATFFARRRP